MPYRLEQDGTFIINDFQQQKVFSNFFPGVAGMYGIPMWAFYINRGQGISSFGIESKDKSILEFQPANKAYRLTSIQGFRTFIKVEQGGKSFKYEPFAHASAGPYKIRQRMLITSHDLTIEEENVTLGLKMSVNYFTLPQEPFAGLVRQVCFENMGKKETSIELVDGLPAINPFGLKDWLGKHICRTVEAWSTVHHVADKTPFYQLKVEVADTPQVTPIHEGNFYFAFDAGGKLLPAIVESALIFGQATDFLVAEKFYASSAFNIPKIQQTSNRTPCGFAHFKAKLKPKTQTSFCAVAGFAHDSAELKMLVKKCVKDGFIASKADENKNVVDGIKSYCQTQSASAAFDQYCGQNFLDNVLRGGLPVSLTTKQGSVSFNVYSRKHGDLERDYNFFTLAPTFMSQGNGNYRDVNQNRRNDVWFNQDVGDNAVINFMNLIQADGYNPLIVKGLSFKVSKAEDIQSILKEFEPQGNVTKLESVLKLGFMPGDLLKLISRDVRIKGKPEPFLGRVLSVSEKQEESDFGEGYWSDHWHYNLDLIERFWSLFPEKRRSLLLEKKVFTFHLSDAYVLPRDKRYVLTKSGVRQYHSVAEGDTGVGAKAKGYKLRVKSGAGDVYHTNLLVKLLSLLSNKVATLDPSGIGVEMEANKPNWYDALNGLPGLLGSSISETFEIKRLAILISQSLAAVNLGDKFDVPMYRELADFIEGLTHVLNNEHDAQKYWEKSNDLKEHYRQSVRMGIEGQERVVHVHEIKKFLDGVINKTTDGIMRAQNAKGIFPTYFYHEVSAYDLLDKSHHGEHVRPKAFKRHDLPFFLEGFVHGLKVEKSMARDIYQGVRKSGLYDKSLKMYRVNADLRDETTEIGRTRIFPSGWLENQSIWLHMEYKYLLELLRAGLYEEFFADAKNCLVPFQDPARYGRSILENSSFIVSSAHEDKNLHGQGFVARLSGSTAEFIHIWLLLSAGANPFTLDDAGQLVLRFNPILPGWLFTQKQGQESAHTYAFIFLNKTRVVYHNPKKKDTFGKNPLTAKRITLKYRNRQDSVDLDHSELVGNFALDVRNGEVERIDILLG